MPKFTAPEFPKPKFPTCDSPMPTLLRPWVRVLVPESNMPMLPVPELKKPTLLVPEFPMPMLPLPEFRPPKLNWLVTVLK